MTVEVCDICGSTNIKEIKCKVICQNCGTILKTCADLEAATPSS
jgi:rubredoxin